jgi:copper chaperone CopZ
MTGDEGGIVDDIMFCQFINEGDNDSITATNTNENNMINEGSGGTITTTDIDENTITTTTNEERIPSRMRRKTKTTSAIIHAGKKKKLYKNPKPFFPLPPPHNSNSSSFSTSYGGGGAAANHGASPTTLLVDPSTGGSFHPDFMFCGNCADCQEEEEEGDNNNPATETAVVNENREYSIDSYTDSDSDTDSTDSSDSKKGFLQTTFQLQQRTKNQNNDIHNDTLVLRSLIRAIPGVRKVSIPNNNIQQQKTQKHNNDSNSEIRIIIIHHDASVHTEIILHALESAGHSAFIRDNSSTTNTTSSSSNAVITTNHNTDPNQNQKCWVRSSFNVQGVCCTSEIPAVRKIVKPLWGVVKVNINLTTKVVHVQHNYIQIQASQIAQKLTEQGFPAQIYKDGAATVQQQFQLFENNNNNKEEEEKDYSYAIADILDRIGQSPYVESTLCVEGLRPNQVNRVEKSIADSFISIQVRAVYPNAISETVKVEHNPELVSIKEIRDFLRQYATDKDGSFPSTAEVCIDGADANLYLPAKEDYPNHQPINLHSANGGCVSWMKIHHVNVWLSGFFWVLSMVSIVNGM